MGAWTMLTGELDDPNGGPRRFLAEAFSNARPVQAEYRTSVGPIQVDRGQANPGTLGAAFDIWVQLQVTPRPQLATAAAGARRARADAANAQQGLMSALGNEGSPGPQAGPWTGPATSLDGRDLLRLAWASALLIEVYRTRMVMPGSPLTDNPLGTPEDLLALASEPAVDELAALTELAQVQLLPRLHDLTEAGPTSTAPTFAGSNLMPADADLVVGHTLVELKSTLGTKTKTGRAASLDGLTLYQLLGYVLHDHDDAHQLTHVALYQARYGHLAVWNLDRLLLDLSGQPVDLPALRGRWAAMLAAGPATS